jgi:hypothetical protein
VAPMRPDEVQFDGEEWRAASGLAVKLLEALGPQRQGCCEKCHPDKVLLPNYRMKYTLALALREERKSVEADCKAEFAP